MAKVLFPAGGTATLRKIDDLLDRLGITIHHHCGVHGCTTTSRYRYARDEVFKLLRFEMAAYAKQHKKVR